MQIAIWDYPPAEFVVSGITSGAVSVPFEVERHSVKACTELLMEGSVDVALLPTLVVMTNPDAVDALPAVALSSWDYPYVRLALRHGLGQIQTVAYDPYYAQETLLTRIALHEHYQLEPEFVPYPSSTYRELLEAEEDARLLIGTEVPTLKTDDLTLDIGREWYELANYPMVWGLFATRKGEATASMIRSLREAAKTAEEQRALWIQSQETTEALHAFFRDNLRVRLDDLAIASLTEFRQYLFYYDVTKELTEIPFRYLTDDEDDTTDERIPLI